MLASYGVVVEAITWERVQQAAMIDPAMQELRKLHEEGFPETSNRMGDSVRQLGSISENGARGYTIQGQRGETKEAEKGDIGGASCLTSRGCLCAS